MPMRFTDILFEFPSIVYNTMDIIKDAKMSEDIGVEMPTEFGIARTKIPVEEILDGMYHQAFSKDTPMSEVNEKGFKCTMLYTKSFGNFVINWDISTFERELNKHLDALEAHDREQKGDNIA